MGMRVEEIGAATLVEGDCREVMAALPADHFASVVCDPPYGLDFMGKDWDHGVPGAEFWREALRVARPGAYLLAFGGTRTYHRLTCAIEDAGWEIRDCVMWVYGSGFPKSHNGAWGGTALKPAWEPIIMARKPLIGTVAANVEQHGTGGLNIDACRVETSDNLNGGAYATERQDSDSPWAASGSLHKTTGEAFEQPVGRWPANLVHDGSEEVLECFPTAVGQIADASSSSSSRKTQNAYGAMARGNDGAKVRGDAGSAARFFYCAKASKSDRDEGNTHPTVKPTELMRYLCRLVTPAGGTVLDPFMGSGSTGKAAVKEGFGFLGIDVTPAYFDIACARVRAA